MQFFDSYSRITTAGAYTELGCIRGRRCSWSSSTYSCHRCQGRRRDYTYSVSQSLFVLLLYTPRCSLESGGWAELGKSLSQCDASNAKRPKLWKLRAIKSLSSLQSTLSLPWFGTTPHVYLLLKCNSSQWLKQHVEKLKNINLLPYGWLFSYGLSVDVMCR